jgi:protein arginine kinase
VTASTPAADADRDVVMSSRVRLARNVAGFPFVGRATHPQRREVLDAVRAAVGTDERTLGLAGGRVGADSAEAVGWIDLATLPRRDRQLLWERHLISRQFAEGDSPRALAVTTDGRFAMMVNEEDHLRLQVMRGGNRLREAFDDAMRAESALGSRLDFAFHRRWGYLTACPTNLGTAVRLSVMVHLPALRLTREIEKVKNAAQDLNLAVRGFLGEGSETVGDLFQISNQVTLGTTEEDLLERFATGIVPRLLEYERVARKALLSRDPLGIEDKIHRALATLKAARLLEVDEAMRQLGRLRLGVALGRVHGLSLAAIDRLMLDLQPVHLRTIALPDDTEPRLRASRAVAVRRALASVEAD